MTDPDPQNAPSARGRRRAWLLAALGLLLAAGGGGRLVQWDFDRPADPAQSSPALFEVRAGMGVRRVAQALEERGLIRSPLLFQLQARVRGGARRIRTGFYEFSPAMPPRRIYRDLIEGRVVQRTVTIPEGFNLREIAEAVQKAGLAPKEAILDLARDAGLRSRFGAEGDSLEGYLFPDTYRFPLGTPPREILRAMAENMRRKFGPALRGQAEQMGFTVHEVLTLASLIEKETPIEAERPLVAAVFLNRLRREMPLQSDPTVIYALPRFEGNLRRRDLAHDSPYNTYLHKGLPPGPIASPGLASIRAALRPADVDYLYFVATPTGGHAFSRTYREHQAAIARHQREQREMVDP